VEKTSGAIEGAEKGSGMGVFEGFSEAVAKKASSVLDYVYALPGRRKPI
jgi:hypothetical protein